MYVLFTCVICIVYIICIVMHATCYPVRLLLYVFTCSWAVMAFCINKLFYSIPQIEPPRGKTNNLHMRKQRRMLASVSAKLISAFVSAKRIVQSVFYLYPKFQASSTFLCLCSSVCVGPVQKPHTTLLVFQRGGSHVVYNR